MKLDELKLSNVPNRDNFLKACLPLEDWQANHEEARAILEQARTSEQLVEMILGSDTMRGTQIYAELSKDRTDHADRILRDISGWIETESDAGGLKVGSDAFSVIIPNGIGDGTMKFAVVGKGCFNTEMLTFWSSIRGNSICIYDYDCGDDAAAEISGRFGVYCGYGFVVFEKWGD